MLKKVFMTLFIFSLSILVSACTNSNELSSEYSSVYPSDDDDQSSSFEEPICVSPALSIGAVEINIMVEDPSIFDPFNENYSGKSKVERMYLQRKVESEYNLRIRYLPYPKGKIETTIIEGHKQGKSLAHIYQVSNHRIPNLVNEGAIVPVQEFIQKYADVNYDHRLSQYTSHRGEVYGFDSSSALYELSHGLFYNVDLLMAVGLESPAVLWNHGEWTWDKFAEYASSAQSKLKDGQYAIGGMPSVYAKFMAEANGIYPIHPYSNTVNFNHPNVLKSAHFLRDNIYMLGLWEKYPEYGTGSETWKGGNVLFHPGESRYLMDQDAWKDLSFNISYVPYPMGPNLDSIQNYKISSTNKSVFVLSAGYEHDDPCTNPITDEVIFRVWNDLQVWKTDEEQMAIYQIQLMSIFDDSQSVEAQLSIVENRYNDPMFAIDIDHYSEGGYYFEVAKSIREGYISSLMESLNDAYQHLINSTSR